MELFVLILPLVAREVLVDLAAEAEAEVNAMTLVQLAE
jgi:hypothetical protein